MSNQATIQQLHDKGIAILFSNLCADEKRKKLRELDQEIQKLEYQKARI